MSDEATLTPSETIYFHPAIFAREKTMLDAVGVSHSEEKVRATDLAVSLLAAAVLADERAGSLRLEPGQKKALFDLRKKETLFVRPAAGAAFPPGSAEARVREAADAAAPLDVEALVRAFLAEDSSLPYHAVVAKAEEGLAKRGLLEVEEQRRLKVLKTYHYKAPEATLALARSVGPADAKALLETTRQARPDVWALLDEGIRAGIKGRTEHDAGGAGSD